MKRLSEFLAHMADMFEVAHAAGRDMSFDADTTALFGPAFRDAMDVAAALERRARLCDDLEAYARELDPHRTLNCASEFVDAAASEEAAAVILPFRPREEAP